jgi:hypothetical protein
MAEVVLALSTALQLAMAAKYQLPTEGRPHKKLAEQAFSGRLVAPALNQNIEHKSVLVDGTPEPVLYTGNLHHNLVQVPFISHTRQPATDLVGECLAELEAPLPYGFMADDDAAGGEDFIDVAQAEWKAEIEPDGMADDLGRKAIAGVAGRGGRYHPVRLRDLAYLDKPDRTQVDGAHA